MSKKKYNHLVFIGRFQPFHDGHKRVIDRALELSENVIILVGSADQPRCTRNPFTFEERLGMIKGEYMNDAFNLPDNIKVLPLKDMTYNEQGWVTNVQKVITDAILSNVAGNSKNVWINGFDDLNIGLIGCEKDHTSYYLKLFPQWGNENVQFLDPINATDIRDEYFNSVTDFKLVQTGKLPHRGRKTVPESVFEFLMNFANTHTYDQLFDEVQFVKNYKEQWESAPYAPTFVTTDAVVVQSGHVLLVRRGAEPGRGQWALPGGFINEHELIEDSMIRELREETKLKVPDPVLRGSIVDQKVFDGPNRSARGRTITHAYLIKLQDRTDLPKVKGSDDADKADWVELANLRADMMFEDHYHIIQNLVSEL